MTDAKYKNLSALLEKLRKNRAAVPLDLLRTKYAAAYTSLCEQIKAEIRRLILSDFQKVRVREQYAEELTLTINLAYEAGDYEHRLGKAAFKEMDDKKLISLIRQVQTDLMDALHDLDLRLSPGGLMLR